MKVSMAAAQESREADVAAVQGLPTWEELNRHTEQLLQQGRPVTAQAGCELLLGAVAANTQAFPLFPFFPLSPFPFFPCFP